MFLACWHSDPRTKMISRKMDKLLSHRTDGYAGVSASDIMIYMQLNHAPKVHKRWRSRRPDTEWADLSGGISIPVCCVAEWWVTWRSGPALHGGSGSTKGGRGGVTFPLGLDLRRNITTCSNPKLFFFFFSSHTSETWGLRWLETAWDDHVTGNMRGKDPQLEKWVDW